MYFVSSSEMAFTLLSEKLNWFKNCPNFFCSKFGMQSFAFTFSSPKKVHFYCPKFEGDIAAHDLRLSGTWRQQKNLHYITFGAKQWYMVGQEFVTLEPNPSKHIVQYYHVSTHCQHISEDISPISNSCGYVTRWKGLKLGENLSS